MFIEDSVNDICYKKRLKHPDKRHHRFLSFHEEYWKCCGTMETIAKQQIL